MKKLFLAVLILILAGGFGVYKWFDNQAFVSIASQSNIAQEFEVKDGEGSTEVGENLEKAGLVKSKYFFYYYVWKTGTDNKIQVGFYELAPNMTIGEMVSKFTKGEIVPQVVKLTVPEGFTNKKIIARLREIRPEIADDFEKIVSCQCINQPDCECDVYSSKYPFLTQLPKGVDMEGFLFPDTYFIDKDDTGADLVSKFLNNFLRKTSGSITEETEKQGKTIYEVVTMASLIEKEAKTEQDMKIVSGIFWKRIADNHPLQSCATLAYVTGQDKEQYSEQDINVESPYNTYLNVGLPIGPVSNPGLSTILAALYPTETDYYFFLTDPVTKEMVYSKTGQEHAENKIKHGL